MPASPTQRSLSFFVPRLPKLPNRSARPAHWAVVQREAKAWHDDVQWLVNIHAPGRLLMIERARLTLTRVSTHEPDPDNLMASWKYVIDGLQRAGVIVDDKRENVEILSQWNKASKRADQGIIVQVEEIVR